MLCPAPLPGRVKRMSYTCLVMPYDILIYHAIRYNIEIFCHILSGTSVLAATSGCTQRRGLSISCMKSGVGG